MFIDNSHSFYNILTSVSSLRRYTHFTMCFVRQESSDQTETDYNDFRTYNDLVADENLAGASFMH